MARQLGKLVFLSTTKQGGMSLVDQAVVSGTNFLTGVFLARFCTKDEYGLYVLAISLLIFWDGVRVSLIGSPTVVFLPRKKRDNSGSILPVHFLKRLLIQ